MTLIESYLRELEAHLRATPERKRQILDELRGHLTERLEDARAADPSRPEAEVEREVLASFGNARDLALAYDPEGAAILKNQAGEVVLRVGRAVGRGTTKALKVLGIGLIGLVLFATVLGVWAFYEVRPYVEGLVEDNMPITIYDYYESCARPCTGPAFNETFYVHPEAKEVWLDLWARHARGAEATSGNLTVSLIDPANQTRAERTLRPGTTGHLHQEQRFAPMTGDWKLRYTFQEFVGMVNVEAKATGLRLRS